MSGAYHRVCSSVGGCKTTVACDIAGCRLPVPAPPDTPQATCPECGDRKPCAAGCPSFPPDPRDTRIATLTAEVERKDAEIARLREALERAELFARIGDNHHNAMLCPYCNPARAALKQDGGNE